MAAMTQIQKLERSLANLQRGTQVASERAISRMAKQMSANSSMSFNLDGPLRQMDKLTERIQKGKITSQEFWQTIKNQNGLLEYQNRLAKSNLETFRAIGNGNYRATLNIPQLEQQRRILGSTAADWATMEAAAKSYGRTVMDQGKNLAFMGRQALLSVTAPIAGFAALTAASFYQVDKGLTDVVKVYGDSSDKMQASNDQIRQATMNMAKQLNNSFGTSVDDTLELAGAFAALGESGSNLDAMTTQAARLMKLGDVATDSATKMISTLRTVFKLDGAQLKEAIDFANEMENSTTLQMQDFADALPKLGPIVESWGGDFREAGVILEAFTRSGVPAVEGANALKSGFASLARTTPQLRGMWDDLTGGKGRTLDEIVKQFEGDVPKILAEIGKIQDAQAWDPQKRQKFAAQLWGKNQLARGMILTENLANDNGRVMGIYEKSAEELAAIADAEIKSIMESASAQFGVAMNNLKIMGAEIGSRTLPVVTGLLNNVMQVVGWLGKAYSAFRDTTGPLGDIMAGFGKFALIAAVLTGPLMLLVAAGKMLGGGMIKGLGAIAGVMKNVRAEGVPGVFQTAKQRQTSLTNAEIKRQNQSAITDTQRLANSVDRLRESYNKLMVAQTKAATTAANLSRKQNDAIITSADAKRRAYQESFRESKLNEQATRDTARATSNSTAVVNANNRALREQWALRREGLRLDSRGFVAGPPRETLTSPNGGVWTRNTRSGQISRVDDRGNRSKISPASATFLQSKFAEARNAQLSQIANRSVANLPVPKLNPAPSADQMRSLNAAAQSVVSTQNRMNDGASAYRRIQTDVNKNAAALATNSATTGRILANSMVNGYSSVIDRQQQAIALQNRMTDAAKKTAAAAAATARANTPRNPSESVQAGINSRWDAAMQRMRTGEGGTTVRQQEMQARTAAAAAAETERMAAAQEAAVERAGAFAMKLGGAMTAAGLLTSMFGSTNATLQKTLTIVSSIGVGLMMWGQLGPASLAKVGNSFKDFFGKFNKGGDGAVGKFGDQLKKLGPMLTKALPWAAIAAAAVGAGVVIYRAVTANARKLREENDKIRDSVEGWTRLLDLAPAQYGQIVTATGEVKDTQISLIDKAMDDENIRPLIDRLKRNSGDLNRIRQELEREAVIMASRGATQAQIQQGLGTIVQAAGLAPQVISQLNIEFQNIDVRGLNGESLSDGIKQQLEKVLTTTKDNTASYWQQIRDGMAPTDLSQGAKARIDDLMRTMDAEMANQDPAQRGKIYANWGKGIMDSFESTLKDLKPEVQRMIKESGGLGKIDLSMLLQTGEIDGDQYSLLKYQQNVLKEMISRITGGAEAGDKGTEAMFNDIASALVYKAAQTSTVMQTYADANEGFIAKMASMGDAFKALAPEEQESILNWYRMSAGQKELTGNLARSAIEAGNLGPEIAELGNEAAIAEAKTAALNEEFGEGKTADWNIRVNIEGLGDFANVDDFLNTQKDIMKATMDDVMEDMEAEFQNQHAAAERARKAAQDAESRSLQDRQRAEEKSFSKDQERQKKQFDTDWDNRIDAEKKAYEDRIKAIEDTQDAEDELERQRKRNAEREERRLKYLQGLMQSNIDYNAAMAGGDLDEAARISLNAQTTTIDYSQATADAEAGYKKEDDDRARSKAIDAIKLEEEARIDSLQKQRDMEREALEERLEMQAEEFQRKQEAESRYLQQKQANEDLAAELSFQAEQRLLNRKLEALRTQIPMNEAELKAHMGRVAGAYDEHGGNLMSKGDMWSTTIENSLITHIGAARERMSNENDWRNFGNRVAEGASQGAFGLNAQEFNHFLRTGELPELKPFIGPIAPGTERPMVRHGGGPIGGGGYDKFNNRGGKAWSAGMGRDEQHVLAQKGEFMMSRKAVNNYGPDFMHAVNSGAFNPGNTGGAVVNNMGAIGGFGELAAAMQAITVGAIISRTVEGVGMAMMNAMSGGGDIGNINIPQKAGQYGSSFLSDTQLKTAALIAETAKEVGASKRDLTIALMTAFQESQMGTLGMYREVDHDSLGAFQQRAPWGPAADRMDIKKSARMFFLGGQGGQPGLFSIKNRNSMSLGAAAQAVQVSAYPSKYDQWQDEAEAIIAAGVGTSISRAQLAKNLRFGGWMTKGLQAYADKWGSSAVGGGGPMNVQPGEYQHPVPGSPVTSGYGMRWGALHDGIDFGAGIGTPIYATKAGTVTFASTWDDGGFGYHTVVDHGNGITSGYAHQSRIAVKPGDRVAKGQNIGFVGNTGQSTGPHLHFQLGRGSSGGKYQYTTDPARFGIPGLRVGGIVGYDNTIANLHKDETVLTAPLSKSLNEGIKKIESGESYGGDIHVELNINAPVYGVNDMQAMLDSFKKELKEELKKEKILAERKLGGR